VKCPLCGYTFDEHDASCRRDCAVHRGGCARICCPHCHYSFVEDSATLRLWRRIWERLKRVRARNR